MKTKFDYGNGLSLRYSNVNNAWFLMWNSQVLSTFNELYEAQAEAKRIVGE